MRNFIKGVLARTLTILVTTVLLSSSTTAAAINVSDVIKQAKEAGNELCTVAKEASSELRETAKERLPEMAAAAKDYAALAKEQFTNWNAQQQEQFWENFDRQVSGGSAESAGGAAETNANQSAAASVTPPETGTVSTEQPTASHETLRPEISMEKTEQITTNGDIVNVYGDGNSVYLYGPPAKSVETTMNSPETSTSESPDCIIMNGERYWRESESDAVMDETEAEVWMADDSWYSEDVRISDIIFYGTIYTFLIICAVLFIRGLLLRISI